ncbi:ferrochelatase [Corynebacterium bovis]|uniref:ferrochelatase n=1 Tax=Corynebacterium bovis TaxID=36808 RepID=UPI0031399F43
MPEHPHDAPTAHTPDGPGPSARRALLYLSFGGPEKKEDVVPFLENVTRGRNIPRERLVEVGEHYFTLGGRSPINDLNRQIIGTVESTLAEAGADVPVYFGNRNWHPFVEDTVAQMARDGITEALVFATSAWGGYSGDRQYAEDITRATAATRDAGLTPPTLTKIRPFHDHPRFAPIFARGVDDALASLPEDVRADADLIFTAHSIPLSADEESAPDDPSQRYSGQILTTAREVRALTSFADDGAADVDLVWQSRSGPPHIPWLEPDICDHLERRVAEGNRDPVVLCPAGFVSDHVEVIWDLDTEAAQTAERLGVTLVRSRTPGPTAEFAAMVVDLMRELWPDLPAPA